ncbi:MAG: replication initiation protein [Bacteroidota bacterium]
MGRRRNKLSKAQKRKNIVKLIVQDNRLIEADYSFDVWETRFFYTLVSMIDKSDNDDKVYRIWFSDIKKLFKLENNKQSYKFLRDAAESILSKSVKIKFDDEQGTPLQERFTLFTTVRSIREGSEHLVADKNLYIDIKILKEVRPFFLDIKKRFDPKIHRYTSYDIRNIISLKPYGTRIYELLKQYQKIGERVLTVKKLKEMFNITDEYKRFFDFYKYVVDKSIKDINKYTDLYIPPERVEKIKKGRSVHAIRFYIEAKPQKEIDVLRGNMPVVQPVFGDDDLPLESDKVQESEFVEIVEDEEEIETEADKLYSQFEETVVKKYGVTPVKFVKMLSTGKYNEVAIQQAVNVTNRAKYNQEIKKSVAGFFLSALKDGYTDAKEEQKKQQKATKKKQEELQAELNRVEAEYSEKVLEQIKRMTTKDPSITEDAVQTLRAQGKAKKLIVELERELGRPSEVEDFRRSPKLRSMVIQTIVKSKASAFASIQSIYIPKITKLRVLLSN